MEQIEIKNQSEKINAEQLSAAERIDIQIASLALAAMDTKNSMIPLECYLAALTGASYDAFCIVSKEIITKLDGLEQNSKLSEQDKKSIDSCRKKFQGQSKQSFKNSELVNETTLECMNKKVEQIFKSIQDSNEAKKIITHGIAIKIMDQSKIDGTSLKVEEGESFI